MPMALLFLKSAPLTLMKRFLLSHLACMPLALFQIAILPAEVLAFTDFDGRTANGNTATDLVWTTNGLEDPGDLSAFQFEGGEINLFDNTPDNEDSFVPAINTGNGNTSWTTTVALTPLPGTSVTVEEITFDYLSMSAAGVINVRRRSDFTITLLNPAGDPVASASIAEVVSGNNVDPIIAAVSLPLDTPVTLSDPGTYQLVLRGGDFLQDNETGNHTGIDNLSINGTLEGGNGLAITEVSLNSATSEISLTWSSVPGQTYTIRYSPDLLDWAADLDDGFPADDGETTTATFDLGTLPEGVPSQLFFRVEAE
jgi:hypothetical protein